MNERFNHLEARIQALDNRIDALANRLDSSIRELRADMGTQYKWMVGLIVVTWVTVMVAVLFNALSQNRL